MADDYDSPWKEAIERHFADFLHFFFPAAHAKIDWSQPITFLEQELRSVVTDAELGKRFVDKLVRVTGLGGQQDWLYIHLEIQSSAQAAFAERMFVYNYRLYDRHHTPIASLAVLADEQPQWRPTEFAYEVLDCRMGIRFPVAKLLDWVGSEDRLDDSDNPFALVTAAHLATRATAHDPEARRHAKWKLVKALYRHRWDKQKMLDLFRVIDWMMRLPKAQAQAFRQTMNMAKEETAMQYVTSIEELALEQGLLQGREQGLHQGQVNLLLRMLSRRFGDLPVWVKERLENATGTQIEAWSDAVFSAGSLTELFGGNPH